MLNIYAQTLMTATHQRPCTSVVVKGRRWWQFATRKCVDMARL
jgi:hypothetical protein